MVHARFDETHRWRAQEGWIGDDVLFGVELHLLWRCYVVR